MYLCLLAPSTHLLQDFDAGVLSFLKQDYKTLLAQKTLFTIYNIDKDHFIILIQKVQKLSITA